MQKKNHTSLEKKKTTKEKSTALGTRINPGWTQRDNKENVGKRPNNGLLFVSYLTKEPNHQRTRQT